MEFTPSQPATHPMDAAVGSTEQFIVHNAVVYDKKDSEIEQCILEAIRYMKALLHKNKMNDARYLLFKLDQINSNLALSMASENFTSEASHVVTITFVNIQEAIENSGDRFEECLRYNTLIKSAITSYANRHNNFEGLAIAFVMSDDGIDDVEILST